jgi:methylmalonyl-CoA/ethylmalonyl-CoA epimerase
MIMSTSVEAPGQLYFDHIGIVVPTIDLGCAQLASILQDLLWTRRFDDDNLGVSVRFAKDRSGIVYEMLAPLGANSPISKALGSKTNLLNQIAYRTTSLDSSVARLRAERAVPIGRSKPAIAFGGAKVQFLMTEIGFLIELIEVDRVVHEFS